MTDRDLAHALACIERLERRVGRLTHAMVGVLAIFTCALILGSAWDNSGDQSMQPGEDEQAPDEVFEVPAVAAKTFLLRDAGGHTRGEWSVSEDGHPQLRFFDSEGQCRLAIGTHPWGQGMLLFDAKGARRAELVFSEGPTARASSASTPLINGGMSFLTVYNARGGAVASFGSTTEGSILTLRNADAAPAQLDASGDRVDYKETRTWGIQLYAGAAGRAYVAAEDTSGRPRAVLGSIELVDPTGYGFTTSCSSLLLLDEEGQIVFKAPVR